MSTKLILVLLLITATIYSKDILKKYGEYNLGELTTEHIRVDGVKFQRNWSIVATPIGENYLNLYKLGLTHYDKTDDIPKEATFYIFNIEKQKKEIIKLPLFDFINKNKQLFFDNTFLKTYRGGRRMIKESIEIIHYDKDSSSYILSDYDYQKVNGVKTSKYLTVYLHWDHKTNEIWGYDLNQFDNKYKTKIIAYDKKNQKLYYHLSNRKNNVKINLIYLDLKLKKIGFMINANFNDKEDKNIYIRSAYHFDNYNKFLLLEYSENKESTPKGYLVYKENENWKVNLFDIPLTAYGVDISDKKNKIFIASNKEGYLYSYNAKTLKMIKKIKTPRSAHHALLFDNDEKLMVFFNTASSNSKRGIGVYNTNTLKLIKYYDYAKYLGFSKFFAQYTEIIKSSKKIIFLNPEKNGFPENKKFSIFEYK